MNTYHSSSFIVMQIHSGSKISTPLSAVNELLADSVSEFNVVMTALVFPALIG